MKKCNIQFSKEAKNDLTNTYRYIKYNLQEPEIVKKLVKDIREEIYKLEKIPKIYPIIDEDFIKKFRIRKIKVKNYCIFYNVNESNNAVNIVRIMNERQNWINLL